MEKELKAKMENLQKKVVKELGESTDVLITSFDDGQCSCIMRGNHQHIAQSLFALIHDPKNQIGMNLYRIVKLIVLNILSNESPYAIDLMTSIAALSEPTRENEIPSDDSKAMLVQMNMNDEPN